MIFLYLLIYYKIDLNVTDKNTIDNNGHKFINNCISFDFFLSEFCSLTLSLKNKILKSNYIGLK